MRVREAAQLPGAFLADAPVLAEGRIELLWVFREQSLASRYHRYGNLLDRAGEARGPVL
jgi:RHH-type proline utilization regulon transcriptional repressor/proline dehydrogenase/delta 1-pyrroline-5-carboxylate dehydrogenase